MTPEHIAVVQESFQKVAAIADRAGEIFYHNLFALDPQVRVYSRRTCRPRGGS